MRKLNVTRIEAITGVIVHAISYWIPELMWLSVMILYYAFAEHLNEKEQ